MGACTVHMECPAASLASAHWMPVAGPLSPAADAQERLQTLQDILWGRDSPGRRTDSMNAPSYLDGIPDTQGLVIFRESL